MNDRCLQHRTRVRVRFQEVDSLRIVWHGHYAAYFEDAREAFGLAYGLTYLELSEAGFFTPLVKLQCDFLLPAKYGDELDVTARLLRNEAAKLEFQYEIHRVSNNNLIARGQTVQVFLDRSMEMILTIPPPLEEFYRRWDRGDFPTGNVE